MNLQAEQGGLTGAGTVRFLHSSPIGLCEHRDAMRPVIFIAALGLVSVRAAEAHIHLLQPLSRTDNTQGDPQKLRHCGDPTVTRTTRVTTYKPGETITVMWEQTIPHPGWYRIAFQPDGEVFEIPPADPNVTGSYPSEDLTGKTDPTTGTIVLKDRIPAGTGTQMADVTLPSMECTNCTLQVLEMMTNNPPYQADTAADTDAKDLYYQCADIALVANNAPDAGVNATPDAGGDGSGSNSGGGGEISSGCSTGNATGLLALVGLVGLRRRRRR